MVTEQKEIGKIPLLYVKEVFLSTQLEIKISVIMLKDILRRLPHEEPLRVKLVENGSCFKCH